MAQKRTRRIFIAATMQNGGKTTFSLGLIFALKKYFRRIGFIKPIGQRYLIEHGCKVDEDSVLIEEICGMKYRLKDMSPVAIDRGFTERYIEHPDQKRLIEHIRQSFDTIARRCDVVVIEGTGHAGVGSVFNLSNATVAKLLDAKAIIISGGGIGRPIDELVLNKALFEQVGVEVAGVVVNKVLPAKFQKIDQFVRVGLSRHGLKVVGVMPYRPLLDTFTLRDIHDETAWPVVSGGAYLEQTVEKVVVGAMEVHDALNHISNNSLIITPGDREDILMGATIPYLLNPKKNIRIAGVILTGGMLPHKSILALLNRIRVPVLLSGTDTYTTVSRVHNLTVKIRPEHVEKIRTLVGTVKQYVDIRAIVRMMG